MIVSRALLMVPLFSLAAMACSSKDDGPTTGGGTSGSSTTSATTGGATSTTGGGSTAGTAGGPCDTLRSYTPTATTPPTFAADVAPIFLNAMSSGPGCGTATICHNATSAASLVTGISPAGADRSLKLDDTPTAVMAALMMNSFSAPGMKIVDPGHVATSFLAHKIDNTGTTTDALSCMASECNGMSSGKANFGACGGPMPMNGLGTLSAAQRTTILDWIALGAMP